MTPEMTIAWLTTLAALSMAARLTNQVYHLTRELQAERAAAAARQQILAAMGHEIRTPMNAITGMINLLVTSGLTPEQQSYAGTIDAQARALLSLVEQLLEEAKLTGQAASQPRQYDPVAVLEQVTELLAPRAHAKGLSLACHAEADVPTEVEGDPMRLRQILINLIGNAIKFTETGGVNIRLSQGNHREELLFSVEDTGIGISAANRERVFEQFMQGTEDPNGTGLGLAISRNLAKAMGGTLSCDADHAPGSRFLLKLPAAHATPRSHELILPFTAELIMPKGPACDLFLATLASLGGAVQRREPVNLRDILEKGGPGHVVVDIAHADELRLLLADRSLRFKPRLWLLLAPEDRRPAMDLLADPRLGHLLKPWRRETLARALHGRPNASLRPREIWVVEDNPVNARLIEAALTTGGHKARFFSDGRSFELALQRSRPELVLMDVELNGNSGLLLTRALRKREAREGRGNLPVLALTAHDGPDLVARCLSAGMDGVLAKPFAVAELQEALARLETNRAA